MFLEPSRFGLTNRCTAFRWLLCAYSVPPRFFAPDYVSYARVFCFDYHLVFVCLTFGLHHLAYAYQVELYIDW